MATEESLDININTSDAQKNVEGLTASLGSLGASFARMSAIIAGFTAINTVVSQFQRAIDEAIKFESEIADIEKVTSEFTAQRLKSSIEDMQTSIPLAREELSSIAEEAGRLGIQGVNNIEQFTKTISKLSVATNLSAKDASRSFARIIAVTDATVGEMENLGSVVNELSNTMATSADEIVDGMLRASAAASRFGLSAEEIAAFSSSINEVSATARRANTRLRRLFQEMQSPKKVDELSKAFDRIGINFEQMRENAPLKLVKNLVQQFRQGGPIAEEFLTIFGSAGRQALAGLAQNFGGLTKAINEAQKEMKEADSLNQEYNVRLDTTASRAQLARNRFDQFSQNLGEDLLPTVNASIQAFGSLAQGINRVVFGITEARQQTGKLIGSKNLDKITEKFEEQRSALSGFGKNLISIITGTGLAAGTIFSGGSLPLIGTLASAVVGGLSVSALTNKILDLANFGEVGQRVRKGIRKKLEFEIKQLPDNDRLRSAVASGLTEATNKGIEQLNAGKISLVGLINKLGNRADELEKGFKEEIRDVNFGESLISLMKQQLQGKGLFAEIDLLFKGLSEKFDQAFESLKPKLRGPTKSAFLSDFLDAIRGGREAVNQFLGNWRKNLNEAVEIAKNKGRESGNNFMKQFNREMASLNLGRTLRQQDLSEQISELSGQQRQRLNEAVPFAGEQSFLGQLRSFEEAAEAGAKINLSPKFRKQVQEVLGFLGQLETESDNKLSRFEKNVRRVSQGAAQSFQDNFVKAMQGGFDSVEDALRGFGKSFVQELQRIVASNAARQLFGQGQTEDGGFDFGLVGQGLNALGSFFSGDSGGTTTTGSPVSAANINNPVADGFISKNGQVTPIDSRDNVLAFRDNGPVMDSQGSGGQTVVNQEINVTTGVQQTVRAEIQRMMPQIQKAALEGVKESTKRGGSTSQTMGA